MTRTVRLTTGAAVTIAALALAAVASAWTSHLLPIECGKFIAKVSLEQTTWHYVARDESGNVLVEGDVFDDTGYISEGFRLLDDADHKVTVEIYNTLDINDGYSIRSSTIGHCGPEVGTPGPAGPGGPPGPKGDDGAPGAPGAKGATGPAGVQGAPGTPGKDGAPGSAGPQGITGGTGANGQNGATGPTGAPGSPGGVGAVGSAGPTGRPGAAGHPGKQGATGHTGTAGKPGRAGASGHAGKAGKAGVTRVVHLTIVKHVAAPKPSPFVCHGCQPKVAG